jgi:uncharacterized protein YjbI with pentapeptide repeats
MPNPEHVRLFLSSRDEWARLRQREPMRLDLRGAELQGADLRYRTIEDVNLDGADLTVASFLSCSLLDVSLRGAVLDSASAVGCRIRRCQLADASLQYVRLMRANLVDVDLSGAVLVGANLYGAVLNRVQLARADLAQATAEQTIWADLDLRHVRNIDRVQHRGPSIIGLNTVVTSQGQIPEAFLRGCGVPEQILAYVQSVGRRSEPIELSSCFISYSSKNHDFCQRLHNDLQAAGVRCWFAPEDLKIGDRFRDEIESAIRLHDKLLLVLSDDSVKSDWVRSEVEEAFERETRERKQVLFPVRLDDAVLETPKAWAADIRRQRQIGDFSRWKDDDVYKRAFERLLRDLRATPSA